MNQSETRVKETLDFYFEYHHRIHEFYAIAKYFYYPDTPQERAITQSDLFFTGVAYASWALVVVDLCKVFSDSSSQRHNIIKLLTDIKTKPDYQDVLAKVGLPLVDDYLAKLSQQQPVIQKLKVLRDKHYVHVDNLTQDLNELENPTFLETETLLGLLKAIIFDINLKVFNAHSDFPDEAELGRFSPKAIVRDVVKQRTTSD